MYDPSYSKKSIEEVKVILSENRIKFDILSDNSLRVWIPDGSGKYTGLSVSESNIVYLGWNPVDLDNWIYQMVTNCWANLEF